MIQLSQYQFILILLIFINHFALSELKSKIIKVNILSQFKLDELKIKCDTKFKVIDEFNNSLTTNYIDLKVNKNKLNASIDNKYINTNKIFIENTTNQFDDFQLSFQTEKRIYYGQLNIYTKNNYLEIILITLEPYYLRSVLATESNNEDPIEYKKALYLVIKNYSKIRNHTDEHYDFCDLTHCQVFKGSQKFSKSDLSVIKSMENFNLILKNNQRAFYTGCCGDTTLSASTVWGRNQKLFSDIACSYCSEFKFYRWKSSINKKDFMQALEIKNINKIKDFFNIVEIETNEANLKYYKDEFRILIGRKLGWNIIYSNRYNISFLNDNIKITGKGFGHNVGLCQYGAKQMALRKKNYKEILEYYFPGMSIHHVN